jgi:hypothetical protein
VKELRSVRIVVASPSDVHAERELLQGVLEEVNRNIAADRGLRLELSRWETDAYPGFHVDGPQGLIDTILKIDDCDVLIGVFWKRFGTPVKDAKSGTEHEFNRAYEAWKTNGRPQIMVYFNQQPLFPATEDEANQLSRVLAFRSALPREGLWWPYKGKPSFEKLVRNHLAAFIRQNLAFIQQPEKEQSGTQLYERKTEERSLPTSEEKRRSDGLPASASSPRAAGSGGTANTLGVGRFVMNKIAKLRKAGFVENPIRELWFNRGRRMAFTHEALRDMGPSWLDRYLAEKVPPQDFVFHMSRVPSDLQTCQDILKEIHLPNLRANVRLVTFAG